MRYGAIILVAVAMGLLLVGCTQSSPPTGYATYNGQGQQQQYVGGGCGVAPPEAGDAKDAGEALAAPAA